jgi:glycogen(starch) synthase
MIPNGVDPADLAPASDAPASDAPALRLRFAAPDQPLILLVGRLVYEKGFQVALEAMPELIRRIPGLRFVLAGTGVYEAELKALASRLGLLAHGSFLGWVTDERLRSLYAIADVCVIPSIYEPCGLVALEAMASGCACVVADVGGLRETVPHEEAGLRFASRDPEALAAAVLRLVGDPRLSERLVARAASWVLGFDWADVAAASAALYLEVSAGGGPG